MCFSPFVFLLPFPVVSCYFSYFNVFLCQSFKYAIFQYYTVFKHIIWLRKSLAMKLWLSCSLLCRPGWLWIHRDPFASASRVLKVCPTMLIFKRGFYNLGPLWLWVNSVRFNSKIFFFHLSVRLTYVCLFVCKYVLYIYEVYIHLLYIYSIFIYMLYKV